MPGVLEIECIKLQQVTYKNLHDQCYTTCYTTYSCSTSRVNETRIYVHVFVLIYVYRRLTYPVSGSDTRLALMSYCGSGGLSKCFTYNL